MIRAGTPADVPAIAAIQSESSWRPEEFLAYELTVLEAESVVAYAVTRTVAPGEHELLEIAVDAAQRRRGHAERLLAHLLIAQAGDWFLEVRASNVAAQALYRKLGFTAVGRRAGYYAGEDAIVLRRSA